LRLDTPVISTEACEVEKSRRPRHPPLTTPEHYGHFDQGAPCAPRGEIAWWQMTHCFPLRDFPTAGSLRSLSARNDRWGDVLSIHHIDRISTGR
jgi:hypothetical protein